MSMLEEFDMFGRSVVDDSTIWVDYDTLGKKAYVGHGRAAQMMSAAKDLRPSYVPSLLSSVSVALSFISRRPRLPQAWQHCSQQWSFLQQPLRVGQRFGFFDEGRPPGFFAPKSQRWGPRSS